jgi:hypothetical protein
MRRRTKDVAQKKQWEKEGHALTGYWCYGKIPHITEEWEFNFADAPVVMEEKNEVVNVETHEEIKPEEPIKEKKKLGRPPTKGK